MSNPFFEKSREIANDFLQSIVFIDDKAYSGVTPEDPNHDFDAQKVSMAFANEKKVCGVYQPKTKDDIENFKSIIKKADVVILDWKIILSENEFEDLNADDEDDPRGIYTLEILKNLAQNKDSLKLIIVYTGETDLNDITNQIYEKLKEIKPDLVNEPCQIASNSFKILIRAKSSVGDDEIDNKFNHLVGLNDKIIKYKDLPGFVLDEFTQMTSGLLSNFALLSIKILRENSSKLLALFSKEMDSAFLSHKTLLPNQDDAEDLLIELLSDTMSNLLYYNKSNEIIRTLIDDWIKINLVEEDKNLLKKDGSQYNPEEKYLRTHELLIELMKSSNKDVEKRYVDILTTKADLSKSKSTEYFKYVSLNNTLLFLNNSEISKKENVDNNFSILTHHKSLFLPNITIPKLSLGTVVKSTTIENSYFICIQQKCDSVRIPKDVERKFLFIPLEVSLSKFDIITPDGVKLKRIKDSFSIRTIKFICKNDDGVIKAEQEANGSFIFIQKYDDEHFEWVLELKDLHSQRIIIEYTSQLSRVGLDESEWHRRSLS